MFFKWMFKTFCAVMIVTNTWDIVMGVFDLAQGVVNAAAGVISSDTSLELGEVVANLEARLMEMEIGPLLGLWFQSLFVGVTMNALTICIFVVIYGRMVEIYTVTSLAPLPHGYHDEPGMGADGTELPAVAVCAGLSGVPDHRVCGDLRGAGALHRHGRGCGVRHLDLHWLHGAPVLHAFQIRQRRQGNLRGRISLFACPVSWYNAGREDAAMNDQDSVWLPKKWDDDDEARALMETALELMDEINKGRISGEERGWIDAEVVEDLLVGQADKSAFSQEKLRYEPCVSTRLCEAATEAAKINERFSHEDAMADLRAKMREDHP